MFTRTGGASDTFQLTDSPGDAVQYPVLRSDGVTVTSTFKGLTPGVQYTFSWTGSNVCGTSGPTESPAFTPGFAPALKGTPTSPATKGKPYRFVLAVRGDPTPKVTVTAGHLPPGLHISATGVISGTPTTLGTYSATVTAYNGVGFQGNEPPATDSFTIRVVHRGT